MARPVYASTLSSCIYLSVTSDRQCPVASDGRWKIKEHNAISVTDFRVSITEKDQIPCRTLVNLIICVVVVLSYFEFIIAVVFFFFVLSCQEIVAKTVFILCIAAS